NKLDTQINKGIGYIQNYTNAVRDLAGSLGDANIALIDFSDQELASTQIGVLNYLGINPGDVLSNLDKFKVAILGAFDTFVPTESQINTLANKLKSAS